MAKITWNKHLFRSLCIAMSNHRRDFPGSSAGKQSSCNLGDPGSIPGIGYSLQYSWASLEAQRVKLISRQHFPLSFIHTDSILKDIMCFLGQLRWRRICLQCERPRFNPQVGKTPWRREWQPTPVFLPGKSHGQRSLAGYSPWSHKKDTSE